MSFIRLTLSLIVLLGISATHVSAQEASLIKKLMPNFSQKQKLEQNSKVAIKKEVDNRDTVKGQIAVINVYGSTFYSAEKIKNVSRLKKGQDVTSFTLQRAKKRIKKMGVYKAVTIKYSASSKAVNIYVDENPRVTSISLEGNSVYSKHFLDHYLKSKINEPVNLNHVRDDIKFIETQYDEDGYFEAKIYRINKPETKDGPLVFKIAEGIVEDIEITGNIKTKDYVILRELEIRPGDRLNKQELQRNLRKVFNLNYFENVSPEVSPGEAPHTHVLKLNIKEKETSGSFTFGGGFQPNTGFNIFTDLYWDNVRGTGQLIMLKGNFGLGSGGYGNRNNSYQLKYHNPWAFGDNRSMTFRLWSNSGSFRSFSLASGDYSFKETHRRGIDTEIGIPHTYDFRSGHKLKYESVNIVDDSVKYYLYTYMLTLSHDKRDQRLNPREGFYNTLSVEQGFNFRPDAVDLTRFDITVRKFFPTFKKQTIYLKTQYGFLRSPDVNNEAMFIDEYYYVGGSRTVRGYADNDPFAYGREQVLGTLEYRFIFTTNITAYFFTDVGFASKFRSETEAGEDVFIKKKVTNLSEYKLSKGIGITFVIQPLGPIRLDYGVIDTGEGRIQFNMGYSF
ncbi:FtsQ-type POTRA domain-containing protein [bacterium]|nr:FtsQ-type POTRA domain-containing protein [bacterium]